MVAPELLDEEAGLPVAGPGGHGLDGEVGLAQQPPGLGHPPLGDPPLHAAPGLAADHGGQVPGRQPDLGRHRRQRDRLAVVRLDELEHRGQQRLAVLPKVLADVDGDPGRADQQQGQVGQRRVG
ncbi:MAG TPA: hypothetical protein VHW06_08290 [Streptosporangiaceae bacterium]|nr:hypothetical protein [Streptosporangiaceae bacterium]